MSKIKSVALVGFGAIAENAHVPALRSVGVAVDAICEPSSVRREAAKRLLPHARVYDTPESLLSAEKSLDALIVCSPPSYHANGVLSGIRAGLHVLCEKPLTLDRDAFNRIKTESIAKNVCVYSINNWAFSPQWSEFLRLAASDAIGRVRSAEIRVERTKPSASALPGDWRKDPTVSGGGILVDHGWHNLYLLRRLLGDELELKQTILKPSGAVDEVAELTVSSGAATGTLFMSWREKARANTAFAMGEKGTLTLEDDRVILDVGSGPKTTSFGEKLSAGSAHPEWLAAMWPAFEAECAGRGRGANLAEAAFCLATIRAAYGTEAATRA